MASVQLSDFQYDALNKLKNGSVLKGGVGRGKSITALAYYFIMNGGEVNSSLYIPMKSKPQDLYIITTALKRDKLEWEEELTKFRMSTHSDVSRYKHKIVVDSWNNIQKYSGVKDAFFIFDEQRVIGYGPWSRTFIRISRNNNWILLTATPGDTWSDYIPVFIANGFYKNKSDFEDQHAIYSRFSKYPKIERWINEGRLLKYKNEILVVMEPAQKATIPHHEYVVTDYDRLAYARVARDRWNVYTNKPIKNASEYCFILRKIVNTDPSRLYEIKRILSIHKKAIIFYSYNYELDLLRKLFSKDYRVTVHNKDVNEKIDESADAWLHLIDDEYIYSEWNGSKHEPIPAGEEWAYLVQYIAGSEGWNCIITDTMIFYSQNYSYRTMVQAAGRIDRMNTPYIDLYYYHLRSNSKIDAAITDSQRRKKKFNEKKFAPVFEREEESDYEQDKYE